MSAWLLVTTSLFFSMIVCQSIPKDGCMYNDHAYYTDVVSTLSTFAGPSPPAVTIRPITYIIVYDYITTEKDQYCQKKGQTIHLFGGDKITCKDEDVLTPQKLKQIQEFLVPSAISRLKQHISVPFNSGGIEGSKANCSPVPTPERFQTTLNTDYLLIVTAQPTKAGIIAFARPCAIGSVAGKKRVFSGLANFGPKYIKPEEKNTQARTTLHEFIHAHGFLYDIFKDKTEPVTIRSSKRRVFTGGSVLAAYKKYFNCNDLIITGAELEDAGGAGSVNTHWEMRVLKDELMTASDGRWLSEITLGLLDDLEMYIIDYKGAESMSFAKNAGCSFLTELCNTKGGGKGKYWEFSDGLVKRSQCFSDRTRMGKYKLFKYDYPLPEPNRYYPDSHVGGWFWPDYCPTLARMGPYCDSPDADPGFTYRLAGSEYHNFSLCYDTRYLVRYLSPFAGSMLGKPRCAQTQCSGGFLQFKSPEMDTWLTCPRPEAHIGNIPGYLSYYYCPNAEDIERMCTIVPNSIDVPPPGGDFSISGQLRLEGVVSSDTSKDAFKATSVVLALRIDIAAKLDISLTAVSVVKSDTDANDQTYNYSVDSRDIPIRVRHKLSGSSYLVNTSALITDASATDVSASRVFNVCTALWLTKDRLFMSTGACGAFISSLIVIALVLAWFMISAIVRCFIGSESNAAYQRRRRNLRETVNYIEHHMSVFEKKSKSD